MGVRHNGCLLPLDLRNIIRGAVVEVFVGDQNEIGRSFGADLEGIETHC